MFSFSNDNPPAKDEKDGIPEKKVPMYKLFRYADALDGLSIFIGCLFAAVHGCGWPVMSLVFGGMTDSFVVKGTANSTLNSADFTQTMNRYALEFFYIGLGVFAASYGQYYFWNVAAERQAHRLRMAFFKSVLRQDMAWLDNHASGELTTRLADDLDKIKLGLGFKTSIVVMALAGFICGFVIGFVKSWKMTLVMMSMTPLMAIGMGLVGKFMSDSTEKEQAAYAKAGGVAEETISCMKTVIMFCGQEDQERRYAAALEKSKREGIKKNCMQGFGFGFFMLVMFASYCLAFWFGATQVKVYQNSLGADGISPGDVFAVFFCVLIGSMFLGMAGQPFTILSSAAGAAGTIFEIIDREPEIDASKEGGTKLEVATGHMEFTDVHFTYPSRAEVPILKGVNFSVKPGQTVALTGPSGCGKSSIVKLILRFYDPASGSIKMDGVPLSEFNLQWYRDQIGLVSQEPILFSCSIMENIRMGREDVTDAEVVAAATKANAHKFISKLPARYDTLVGERGAQLSGGQKQRIAIARALVKNPVLLLLDEATSALDSQSESSVQKALDAAAAERTTFIIAHRLSTVRNADLILSVADGVIVEAGTHEELLALKGQYYQLVTLQELKQTSDENKVLSAHASPEHKQTNGHELVKFTNGNLDSSFTNNHQSDEVAVEIQSPNKRRASVVVANKKDNKLTEEEKEELKNAPGYFEILKMNSPEWYYIVIASFGGLLLGGGMPVFAIFFADVVTVFTKTGDEMVREATNTALLFLALGASQFIGQMLMSGCLGISGERLTHRLRCKCFSGMMRQDMSYFEDPKNSTGALTTRLASDASSVNGATGVRISVVFQALSGVIVGLTIALVYGWKLALMILGCTPLMAIAGFINMKFEMTVQKDDDESSQLAGKTASEAIENLSTVQSLGRERKFYDTYVKYLTGPHRHRICQSFVSALTYAFSEAVIFFIYGASFRFGAYLVDIGDMEMGNVFKVFFSIAFTGMTIGQVTSLIPDYAKAKIAAYRIMCTINKVSAIDNKSTAGESLSAVKGEIALRDTAFHYPTRPDAKILTGLNLNIESGQTVALVGASGCGKSTVVSLVERLYDPLAGGVFLDGKDIRMLNVKWLRQNVRIVSQEPILFARSIKENIIYGLDGPITDEMIVEAAKQSNIHSFIEGLPDGYDTEVGEKGTQLSGGQKQRVALARALITRPKILLLDEATSALDSESEAVVQAALEHAREGRTCILIAHRLSTVQNADKIVVMEAGQVIEEGTHDSLMRIKGAYYALATGSQDAKKNQ